MTLPKITKRIALELLAGAVERRGPDTVVTHCAYVTDDMKPCCLIGEALIAHGVAPETFGGYNETGIGAPDLLERLPAMSQGAVRIFAEAQDAQDDHRPWSEALKVAQAIA